MSLPPEPEWMRPIGKPWRRIAERVIYDNPWIRVAEYDAEAPTGAQALYGMVGFKNLAVGVLPIFEDGTVMLVGQHRFPAQDYSWEIPEGGVGQDEDPLEGAMRELKEETGLEAREWREVLSFQLSNCITDERGVGLIAMGLTQVEAQPDETEDLALARIPFREALDQAMAGRIWDLVTLAVLLRVHHMAIEGELPEGLAMAMLARTGQSR